MKAVWIAAGTTVGMAIPLAIWGVRDPRRFFVETLGVNVEATRVPWAWTLAALVVTGYIAYTFWAVPFVRHNVMSTAPVKLVALPLAFASGTLEELLFRKFLMDWLDANGATAAPQVMISALAFGSAHAVWAMFARDPRILLPTGASTAVLGGALACVYLVGERLALPVVLAHILINLVIEPWLLVSAVSGGWSTFAPTPEDQRPGNG